MSNTVLAALAPDELRALEPCMDLVRLQPRKPLYEPGEPARAVYFPLRGMVSLLYVHESGTSAALTVIGRESMLGISALLGADHTPSLAVVSAAGTAMRLPMQEARAAFAQGGGFHALTLRAAHVLVLQIAQTAVCNLHHSVEQQLCRWLLQCLDRLPGDDIDMTHEFIAMLLGVRRQGVSEAARKLQQRGVIRYARGRISVLDTEALERCACECYGALKKHTATAFS